MDNSIEKKSLTVEQKDKLTTAPLPVDINSLQNNPELLKLYANGFTFGFSLVDATIVMQVSNQPIALVNLPFGAVKSLSNGLLQLLETIENSIGEPIKDISSIKKTIQESKLKK